MINYADNFVYLTKAEEKVFRKLKLPIIKFHGEEQFTFRWVMALCRHWGIPDRSYASTMSYCAPIPKYYFNDALRVLLISIYTLLMDEALELDENMCVEYKQIAEKLYKELK